jgi:hypothetical protein
MNRRRWLVGAGCLAGALLGEWRLAAQQELQQAGVQTLAFWTGMADILGRQEQIAAYHKFDQTPDEVAAAQLRLIDALPREGVDEALLAFTARLGRLREKLAAGRKEERWYHGYIWSPPKTVVAARKEAAEVAEALKNLRSSLAKKYGVAFPECPSPAW